MVSCVFLWINKVLFVIGNELYQVVLSWRCSIHYKLGGSRGYAPPRKFRFFRHLRNTILGHFGRAFCTIIYAALFWTAPPPPPLLRPTFFSMAPLNPTRTPYLIQNERSPSVTWNLLKCMVNLKRNNKNNKINLYRQFYGLLFKL